jgi:tRNA pseudouridine13 synthase
VRIKVEPEDFVVEEIAAYAPSGSGEHLFVRFEKRDLSTREAVYRMARALGVDARDAGVAGQKDRRAVTVQTVSFQKVQKESALALDLEGIRVISAERHGNKLRPGHLLGNRFRIRVRDVSAIQLQEVMSRLKSVQREGVPNAFGPQRFGRDGDNHLRARAWLRGQERGPRDRRMRAFMFSALQAHVFNRVLARRIEDGTWNRAVSGDLLKRTDSGALFVCTDVQTDDERARRGEVSATGPMFGAKMLKPEGPVRALEDEVMRAELGGIDLSETRALGQGTRRALRIFPADLRVTAEEQPAGCLVEFVLPKGAFATTVLSHLFQTAIHTEEEG